MSVLNAIFQAIVRALAWVLPISESGHASILNDFSGRADGSVYAVTGVIHIGIAIGIFLAMYKLFINIGRQIGLCVSDLAHKSFSFKHAKPARQFTLMLLISYVPLLLWLIPIGSNGLLYKVLSMPSYNNTLLDEGLLIAITGLFTFLAARQFKFSKNDRELTLAPALVAGGAMLALMPVAGLSPVGCSFAILLLFGVSGKTAVRYSFAMSMPILLIAGIVQLCAADIKAGALEIIFALLISVIVSFVGVKLFKWLIKNRKLVDIAYYDFALGALAAIIGIIQLIVR